MSMNVKARGAFLALAALAGGACGDNGNPMAPSDPVAPGVRFAVIAFGDSLTLDNASYVRTLERMLASGRGPGVTVRNAGRSGELLQSAVERFKREIGRSPKADVVIILEGTHDMLAPQGSLRASAIAASGALERMLDLAGAANVTPIMATIPPIRATGRKRTGESTAEAAAAVSILNGRIRQIAQARGIRLVDVERVIRTGNCAGIDTLTCKVEDFGREYCYPGMAHLGADTGTETLPCLDESGYHLTVAGYALLARAFVNAIQGLR